MLKKIIVSLIISLSFVIGNMSYAKAPSIGCIGLPGCSDTDIMNPKSPSISKNNRTTRGISEFVSEMIKYVSVLAVLSLMIAGIMYLVSGGEEEKVNKAKKMIIWSLVGVLLSISAWMIVNVINDIDIL